MNEYRERQIDKRNVLFLGMILAVILTFLFLHPRTANTYDTQMIEVLIVEKEITEMDGKEVYFIHGEDREGNERIFQITKAALSSHFEEADVYEEIKTGKYYKLKVSEPEMYNSYYPSICGAVKLIDGFTSEPGVQ